MARGHELKYSGRFHDALCCRESSEHDVARVRSALVSWNAITAHARAVHDRRYETCRIPGQRPHKTCQAFWMGQNRVTNRGAFAGLDAEKVA